MKLYIKNTKEYDYKDDILCMSNARGKYIQTPHKLPFSFYFSSKNSSHGPRVKLMFNPDHLRTNLTGTLKLCDDWNYSPSKDDKHVPEQKVNEMKEFFKDYIVLCCLGFTNR